MRAAYLLLVACSSATPRVIPIPVEDPGVTITTDQFVRAAHARWVGDPATAAKLLANAGDIDGLAELGRAELALGHVTAADRAFERAVTRAERETRTRGAWQWPTVTATRIAKLAFTPNGRWLARGDAEGRVDIYDFASMRIVRSFSTYGSPRVFEISPNNRWLATGKETTQIWDLETGAVVGDYPYTGSVVFTPSNRLLATRMDGGFVEVDIKTKEELRVVIGPKFTNLVTSGDKIYGIADKVVKVFDANHDALDDIKFPGTVSDLCVVDGKVVAVIEDALVVDGKVIKGRYYSLVASGSQFVVALNGRLQVWEDGKLVRSLGVERTLDAMAFHPLGTVLATGGWESSSLWNTDTAKHLTYFAKPPAGALALAFDARGDKLAVGSGAGHATVWTLATGAVSTMTVVPRTAVEHVAFGPDGEFAASATDPNQPARGTSTLVTFDARGEKRWSREVDHIWYLGYRPGTRTLSTTQITPKDVDHSEMATVLWKPDGTVENTLWIGASRGFHWNLDGSAFVGSTNQKLVMTKLDGTSTRFELSQYRTELNPSGTLLAATNDDGRIGIWDLQTRRPTRVLFDANGSFAAFAWTPDGKTLVTASHDTATLWDPVTGNRLAAFVGPAPIVSLVMHPSGRLFATGHDDGRVTLWSIAGEQIATLHSQGELAAFVTTTDGKVDGTLSDHVLAWSAGAHVLPARGAFARQHVPHLLATRIATVPADAQPPHAHPVAPPRPPTCYPEGEYNQRSLRSATVDGNRVRLCLDYSYFIRTRVSLSTPTICFDLDLATGKHTPLAPSPRKALGISEDDPVTTEVDGAVARVCQDGHCKDIKIRAAENPDTINLHITDDAKLLAAVYRLSDVARDAVLVYDVASGKRISQFIAQGDSPQYQFLDETMMVTSTPCAGPCSSSTLFDVRKGREVGGVGVNTSSVSPTKIAGNVWAFNDWDSLNVVLQNVKTGRISDSFKLPRRACTNEPDSEYVTCEGITLLTAGSNIIVLPSVRPGDVMVVDQKGKLVAEHPLPVCQ